MTKIFSLFLLICCTQLASGQPYFFKKVPLPVKTNNEVFFDCKYPWLITGERKLYNIKIYVQNLETNSCDSFTMETPSVIKAREMGLDIEIMSADSFYLLTNERLLKIGHKGPSYHIQEVTMKKGYSRSLCSYNGQIYTVAAFTPNAKKSPKINIQNISNGKAYSHFTTCDPHAIFGGYYPVALSSNGIFCIVEDNLHPSLTFISNDMEKLKVVEIHSLKTPSGLIDKACDFDKKYIAFGSQDIFDSLNYYLDKIPTIESVFFIDTNKVLIVATESGKVDLDHFMQVITFDAQWNIVNRKTLNPLYTPEEMRQPFNPEKLPLNPYGMRIKVDEGFIIVRNKCVDFDKMKTNSEYISHYNATQNRDCYYFYRTR